MTHLYQLVDDRARKVNRDRRIARGETDRHHRRDRVRRHRARRAPAPIGARLRVGPPRPRRPTDQCRTPHRPRDLQERRVRSLACRLQGTQRRLHHRDQPRHHDRRRRHPRRAGVERHRPGDLRQLRHRDPLRRCGVVRLTARLRCRDQPAGAVAHRRSVQCHRHHATPRRRVDLLRRRQPSRQRAGEARQRRPVRHRHRLAQRSRREPSTALGRRCSQPQPRTARSVPQGGAHRTRRRRCAGARVQNRAAAREVGQGPTRRSRSGTRRQRRLARRVCVHEGARRAGAHRRQGPGAGVDRSPLDHRVRARRTEARLDPRLPHGRAGPDLLRPRSARRVPRRARGDGRRHPRRHRRGLDHRRRRTRPGASPRDHPGRLGRHQPAEVPDARRQRERLVPRAPDLRRQGPTDRRPRVPLPRTAAACRAS